MSKLFFLILLRYIAALFVACVTSSATFAIGIAIMMSLTLQADFAMHALMVIMGFAGVLSGTYCLERSSRSFGSVVLLGFGLGFSTWLWTVMGYNLNPPQPSPLQPFFLDLMAGGLVAVVFFWINLLLKRKTSKQI